MKACVLYGINDIRYENVELPKIKDNEVLVKVRAVGICGSDIPRIYKTGAYHYPIIVGHEFSGQVVETGCSVDKEWLNKRVGVFPLIPCKKCVSCKRNAYEMCRNYSYLGSRRNGGFAEYVAVPQDNLIELPEGVGFEEAAMFEPMAVAVHAIRGVNPGKNDVVAVCGLGTIGLMIVMFLMEMGVENILVTGNKDFQKQCVVKMGLSEDSFCDCRIENVDEWIKNKTDGNGADVFFECVGKNETFKQVINNAVPMGKIQLVGNPYSDMSLDRQIYWKILRNQLTVSGTWNSSFTNNVNDDWHYVIERLKNKRINPTDFITHKFSLSELEKGLRIMYNKSEDYVKIMVVM